MLRGEVGARALRVRSDVRGHGQVRLCKALGCGRCGCLKPIRACCVVGSAFFLVAPPRGGCAMAPRDSGMCWKQFMMCLEEIQFAVGVHSPPMHDPGRRRNSRPCGGSASRSIWHLYLINLLHPRKWRTRAPVLTGGPGAAPGGVASKNGWVYMRVQGGFISYGYFACVRACRKTAVYFSKNSLRVCRGESRNEPRGLQLGG